MDLSKFILEVSHDVIFDINYNIHRTLKTKAQEIVSLLGDHYLMIGFYKDQLDVKCSNQFINKREHYWDQLLLNFENIFKLPHQSVLYGHWISANMAPVIMLPQADTSLLDIVQKQLNIIMNNQIKFDDTEVVSSALSWAFCSFFALYHCKNAEKVIIHYHDWQSGLFQLLFQSQTSAFSIVNHSISAFDKNRVKFMYTIHESCLGKQYQKNNSLDPSLEAKKAGVYKELIIEKQLITTTNLFTAITQSLTAECDKIYGKRPEIYLYTGIDSLAQKGELDDTQLNFTHKFTKQQIMKFVKTAFYGQVNLDRTSIVFTAGKDYENDGFELFIDAIALLNKQVKDPQFIEQYPQLKGRSVICLILHEAKHKGLNIEMLRKTSLMKEAEEQLAKVKKQIHANLIRSICKTNKTSFNDIKMKDLCDNKELLLIQNIQQSLATLRANAPIVTHEIEDTHPLLKKLQQAGINNAIDDYAKIIWIPEKLTTTSVIGLDFKEFVRGAHIGVFAGLYKPFSYKVPECICNGTASIVSSTQGFGSFIQNLDVTKSESQKQIESQLHSQSVPSLQQAMLMNVSQEDFQKMKSQKWLNCHYGVQVLDRQNLTKVQQTQQLYEIIIDYLKLNMYERIQLRNTMTRNSHEIDWKIMIKDYVKAYDFASMK
ncbi:putative Glycogen synthase [Spironucleus salmonicida]|uniref:Glycogen [starch] synthase n=1 Tax=Spironucleus salmonicida TaxID=348837 RepID=V6LU30_9EUKA|nr:putative Glycogen synthase [Spironucleus salmonicida]|eukprot:EST47186.1 Glycogen synthase [Spironucleus salmonicida]